MSDIIIGKILVAVDGSESSFVAADRAIYLAERHAADLHVIYVIPHKIGYAYTGHSNFPAYPSPQKDIIDVAMEDGQKVVNEIKQTASSRVKNVQNEVLLGGSSVVKEIVEYSEKHDINLIVLGTRGMSGIKKMLLGSIASGVVTYSHCPVMVVK